ncbi:MAG: hypothetical protein WC528_03595 [Patescibacteria group bacterium]
MPSATPAKSLPNSSPLTCEFLFELEPACRLDQLPAFNRDLFGRVIARKTKERFVQVFLAKNPRLNAYKASIHQFLGVSLMGYSQARIYRLHLDLTRLQSTLNPEYFTVTCEALWHSLQQKPLSAEIDGEKRQLNFF